MMGATGGSPEAGGGDRPPIVVGMGGNVGAVAATFRRALAELVQQGVRVGGVSRLYGSRPLGPEQANFVNAAVLCHWHAPLPELLGVLQELEHTHGRERTVRWGPRTLDLDILFAGPVTSSAPELVVPHAALAEREFALRPLLDLAPDARDPRTGRLYRDVLTELAPQGVWELADPAWPKALPESGVAR